MTNESDNKLTAEENMMIRLFSQRLYDEAQREHKQPSGRKHGRWHKALIAFLAPLWCVLPRTWRVGLNLPLQGISLPQNHQRHPHIEQYRQTIIDTLQQIASLDAQSGQPTYPIHSHFHPCQTLYERLMSFVNQNREEPL